MSIYLTFTNELDANTAQSKIWCNYLLSYANNVEKLVGNGSGTDYFLSDIEIMPDNELCLLKQYGTKQGIIQTSKGLTDCWSNIHQCDNDVNLFVFIKPDNSLMTGVVNYSEEEKNPLWWPPYII